MSDNNYTGELPYNPYAPMQGQPPYGAPYLQPEYTEYPVEPTGYVPPIDADGYYPESAPYTPVPQAPANAGLYEPLEPYAAPYADPYAQPAAPAPYVPAPYVAQPVYPVTPVYEPAVPSAAPVYEPVVPVYEPAAPVFEPVAAAPAPAPYVPEPYEPKQYEPPRFSPKPEIKKPEIVEAAKPAAPAVNYTQPVATPKPYVPAAPVVTAQPAAPVVNAQPAAPVVTAQPAAPVVTAQPAAPVVTAQPAAPVVTAQPAAPVVTAQPATPVVTAQPAAPVVTAQPAAPVVTAQPAAPVVTVQPAAPVVTAQPAAPVVTAEHKTPVVVTVEPKANSAVVETLDAHKGEPEVPAVLQIEDETDADSDFISAVDDFLNLGLETVLPEASEAAETAETAETTETAEPAAEQDQPGIETAAETVVTAKPQAEQAPAEAEQTEAAAEQPVFDLNYDAPSTELPDELTLASTPEPQAEIEAEPEVEAKQTEAASGAAAQGDEQTIEVPQGDAENTDNEFPTFDFAAEPDSSTVTFVSFDTPEQPLEASEPTRIFDLADESAMSDETPAEQAAQPEPETDVFTSFDLPVEPQAETVSEPDAEADPFAAFDAPEEPQAEAVSEPDAEADPFAAFDAPEEPQAEAVIEPDAEADPFAAFGEPEELQTEPVSEPDAETDPFAAFDAPDEPQAEAVSEPDAEADPFAAFDAPDEPQAEAVSEPDAEADPFAAFDAPDEPQAEAVSEPDAEADPFAAFDAPEESSEEAFPPSAFASPAGDGTDFSSVDFGGFDDFAPADGAPLEEDFGDFGDFAIPDVSSDGEAAQQPEALDEQQDLADSLDSALPSEDFTISLPETDEHELIDFGSDENEMFADITADAPAASGAEPQADDPFGGFDLNDNSDNALDISPDSADAQDDFNGFALAEDEIPADAPADGGFDGFGVFSELTSEVPDADPTLAGNLFDTGYLPRPATAQESSIFTIADNLNSAVLARAYNEHLTDNNLLLESSEPCLMVNDIMSEYYVGEKDSSAPRIMFDGISFKLNRGCCCALVSDIPLAAYELARNISECYDSGVGETVTLAASEDGRDLEILYLGSDEMLPADMTLNEYLLYSLCSQNDVPAAERAEQVKTLIAQSGLAEMQDEKLSDLSHNKRMFALALSAAANPNIGCLIVNDPKFNIEGIEENIAKRVFALLLAAGKCALLASCSSYLCGTLANRVIVLANGAKVYDGSYTEFIDRYCIGIMSFNANDPARLTAALEKRFSNVAALCKGSLVYLVRKDTSALDIDALVKAVSELGADASTIMMDEKSFDAALKEVFGR